ncbi:MAG TPA: alpha/beta fold hydrolase, partial [Longimicrobiales bacterium]|nr:alpha/beta fold hydrolase [Longimicrobiales bacterium]
AIEELEPGGTLQFAAGTYLVGERVRVPVPGVTILGDPAGTTLRGCEPSELERRARMECMGLELTGGRQTVRGLTFEHAGFDLILGCCIDPGEAPPRADPGGYLVEDNTFQASVTGVRVIAGPSETTVIRGNRFRDLFHAVGVNHGTVHIVDNDVSAPRPERVPGSGHTGGAITVNHRGQDACDGHEIARNRIEDHASAIVLVVRDPGTRCRGSVIRDNTIVVRRAHFTEAWPGIRVGSEADSTVVGVPIAVVNLVGSGNQPSPPAAADPGGEAVIGGHLIEGNRVMGAEGIGIEIRGSSGNRIVGNVVTGIEPRDPFPGNVANSADPEAWREANGSGIWISPGSEDNDIVGNTFEDVAAYAVFLEGDRNRVELRSSSDRVRDLGTGNRVTGPGSSTEDLRRDEPLYDSKFVEARGIRLQYMDFGGSGLPVIFVQDFHDYFSLEEESQHAAWLSRFADDFRVLAPVRRGYGESDETGWGYDVATQSMDLLGLMDALGIRRAVLVGRNAATQDMTWIAEHYPERLAGLVYLENPLVFPDYRDPLARTFAEMYWRGTCDLGAGDDAIARTGPRVPWRPHFLYDDAPRIDIPALRFFAPQIESRSVDLRRLDRLAIIAASDHCGDEPAREYFVALAADEERVTVIRQALTEGDLSLAVHHAMGRAFGTNLRTVTMEGDFAGREAIRDFRDPHIRSFLEAVALQEAARQPRPTLGSQPRE